MAKNKTINAKVTELVLYEESNSITSILIPSNSMELISKLY
jgi:hypothetical protein